MARIVPAEQEALDRPWRKWASIAVGGFVVVSLIFGFLVLPTGQKGAYGLDTFSAICRAFGVPGYGVNAGVPRAAQHHRSRRWPGPPTRVTSWPTPRPSEAPSSRPRSAAAATARTG